MVDQLDDRVLDYFVTGVLIVSMASWFYILSTWRRGQTLPCEPRQSVPWGPAAGILAMLFALKPLLSSWGSQAVQHSETSDHQSEPLVFLFNVIASEVLLVGGFAFCVLFLSGATVRDMGLPNGKRQLARDILIGIVAFAAAIVPVIAIQAILQFMLHNSSSGHELIRLLTEGKPSTSVLVLGAVTAIIIAPICEEITFRLLFQGWLESWEYNRADRSAGAVETSVADETLPTEPSITEGESLMTNAENVRAGDSSHECEIPRRGVAGLPLGWFPILVSSLLFALAHFGYGPEPVPLFFLALALGFVYQRTHRILPSIVAHALFNSFSMIILWRTVLHLR